MKFEVAILSKHSIWDDSGPKFDTCGEAVEWITSHRDEYTFVDDYGKTKHLPLMVKPIYDISRGKKNEKEKMS